MKTIKQGEKARIEQEMQTQKGSKSQRPWGWIGQYIRNENAIEFGSKKGQCDMGLYVPRVSFTEQGGQSPLPILQI